MTRFYSYSQKPTSILVFYYPVGNTTDLFAIDFKKEKTDYLLGQWKIKYKK